jgi:hypothetical protein
MLFILEKRRGSKTVLLFDDIFLWEGWGGKLKLGSGRCRLRVFNLERGEHGSLTYLRPVVVIAADLPGEKMSVRSCAGHIATRAVEVFEIDPPRMLWVEHCPEKTYGIQNRRRIGERFELVEFVWHEGRAIQPKWRPLKAPLLKLVHSLVEEST